MTRRTILSMLVALFAAVLANFGGTSTASAQCCRFTVNIDCNVPAACLPINVKTNWTGGGVNASQLNVAATTGCNTNVFGIVAVPCPPQPVLNVYSLAGGAGIPFGAPPTRVALPGGCCVWTWATFDASGCVIIHIVPC
jgi:hypothetical protein